MDATELTTRLGISTERLDELVAAGLPHGDDGRFDACQVREWLISAGYAAPRRIVTTLAAVGQEYGVSERAAAAWRARGMPGEPNNYDLDLIDEWLAENDLGPSRGNGEGNGSDDPTSRAEAERRRAWAVAGQKELELGKLRGELVEVGTVAREFTHAATHARALLEQIPDRLLAALPAATTGEEKRRFRAEAERAIDQVVTIMHETLKRRAAEAEEADGGHSA